MDEDLEIRERVRLGELVSLRALGETPCNAVALAALRVRVQRKAKRKARGASK